MRGNLGKNIKRIANMYIRKYDTNNPFIIADNLNIQVFHTPLGRLSGYYKYMKRHKCIFINSDIEDDSFKNVVMAHELGHAILDSKENCYFMNSKTLLLTSKIEKRANIFAAELLIRDELLREYEGYTLDQIAGLTGFDVDLIKLKYR